MTTLMLLLLLGLLGTGYVHPDEHMQALEPMGAAVWGVPADLPWEFAADAPARSAVPPATFVGAPLLLARALGEQPGWVALYLPRLAVLGAQLALLRPLRRAFGPRAAAAVAGSWVSAVFVTRPFSNAGEALLLQALFLLAAAPRPSAAAVGALCALGVFWRFTFPLFAWPAALWALRGRGWRGAAVAALAGALAAAALVAADSAYFGALTVTPLNALRYNASAANLARHGLHPRWTHAAVNLPLLFAPQLWAAAAARLSLAEPVERVALATVLSAVLGLSLAPHQEPRFLVPLLLPLALLGRRSRVADWRWFHWALTLVFAGAHQAGVARAVMWLPGSPCGAAAFQGTYPPPHALLGSGVAAMRGAGSLDCVVAPAPLVPLGASVVKSFWPHLSTDAGWSWSLVVYSR